MFEHTLSGHLKSGEKRDNVITDGKHTCTYGNLPGIIDALDAFALREGLSPGECPVLRCGNTLREAVVLLWMLSRKRDFLLLPRVAGDDARRKLEDANLPEFCKFTVEPARDLDDGAIDLKEPGSYVHIRPNANYKKYSGDSADGNIFLRTSGSTAEPKLVRHSNGMLFKNALNCVERFQLHVSDRILIPVPIYHMYGLGAGFLPGFIAGVSMYLIDGTNIIKYMGSETQFKPTVSFMTPTLCRMALRTRKRSYAYRLTVTAGDRINKTTFLDFEERFGTLVNLYGSTELGAIATSDPAMPLETRSDAIVKTMPGVEVALKEKDKELSELMCRHGSGFDTYVDRTGAHLAGTTDGWFETKDLGRVYSEDTFKVIGRTGNSINRSGILTAFSEVESLMEQGIDEVQFAVVTANDEENVRGRTLVACCELKRGVEAGGKDIRARCFDVMMRHMVPDEVIVMDEIPRLPNGKFDRKKVEVLINRRKNV